MNAVELRQLTKSFGSNTAVDALDLDIRQGGIYGFLGPNGSGKTTTIRMILSILYPDSGDIRVLGKANALESKQRIGYLPEERGLYPRLSVGQFLTYLARLKGVPAAGIEQRIRGWLERVELGHVYNTRCEDLSRGMKQKVQTLQALVHEPDLLILDEPFSGLDPVNRRLMAQLFLGEAKRGCTLLICTHMMHHAEELCEHIVMMNMGHKVIDGPIDEVRARDASLLRLEPLGEPDLDALRAVAGVASVRLGEGAIRIEVAEGIDPSSVMPAVTAAVPTARIEIERASLEDVFIAAAEAAQ